MSETRVEYRQYPRSCLSQFCGHYDCPSNCRHLTELNNFKKWRVRTNAVCVDPIWNPNYYKGEVKD